MQFDYAGQHDYQAETFAAGGETFQRPSAEELLRWRLWQRTGSGLMTELGSHQVEAAAIFLTANNDYYLDQIGSARQRGERVRPLNVYVSANRNIFGIDRQISDHVTALIEYPAPDYDDRTAAGRMRKICMQYSTINGNGFGGYGEIVFGMDGSIIITSEIEVELLRAAGAGTRLEARAEEAAMLDTQDSGPAQQAVAGAAGEVSKGYDEQLQHWAWCIRRNPRVRDKTLQPRCHPEVALADAVTTLVTNIAADTNQSIEFREEWFNIRDEATPEWDYLAQDPNFKPCVNKEMYRI
jgi:predicted dehydrogenase